MPWLFSIKAALHIFAAQRLRTVLAVLGVFLGALLLTVITHILGAVNLRMENEAKKLGSHAATVAAGRAVFSHESDTSGRNTRTDTDWPPNSATSNENTSSTAVVTTLTREQLQEALNTIPFITAGTPYVNMEGRLGVRKKNSACQILGVTPDYLLLHNVSVAHGRFFNAHEEERKALVCSLGYTLAERLFNDPALAVGEYVRLEHSLILVTGVMRAKGADSSGTNMDEVAFLPLGTAMQRFASRDHVSGFYVGMHSRDTIHHLEQSLSALLRSRHRLARWQRDDFSITLAGKVEEMFTGTESLVTTLGIIGAGISFGVGTLGVFSIMILMVHARKTEIGIRRALGASRKIILRQFLCEAALMAGGGGMLGVLAAQGVTWTISLVGLLPAYGNPVLAAGVCLLSLSCGLLAGGYPAWMASRLSVIAALRG